MFSYYGSKSKIIDLYPPPVCDKIIEPFAGSARYALKYWERDVLLCDLSNFVVDVWEYLIEASVTDVMGLPDVPSKVHLDAYKTLSAAERYLIGFHLCRGKAKPRKTGHGQNSWSRDKERIAKDLYKIRHWKIEQKSFTEIPNVRATWFVDPPYQSVQSRPGNSDRYPHWQVDYAALGRFILSRKGQVIACEGSGAEYLPFELLTTVNTNTNNSFVKRSVERIFVR